MENCMGRRIEQEARLAVDADKELELLGLGDRALVRADLRRQVYKISHLIILASHTTPRTIPHLNKTIEALSQRKLSHGDLYHSFPAVGSNLILCGLPYNPPYKAST